MSEFEKMRKGFILRACEFIKSQQASQQKKKPYDIRDLNNYSNIFAIDISNYYFSKSSHISEVQ